MGGAASSRDPSGPDDLEVSERGDGVAVVTVVVPEYRDGPLASTSYGSWSTYAASIAERARDRRWMSRCVVAKVNGRPAGLLPVACSRTALAPDPYLRSALGVLAGADARRVAVLGTHADFCGGGVVRRHHDRLVDEQVLRCLVDRAARLARAEGRIPFAPYVEAEQVPSFLAGLGADAALDPAEVHSTLDLRGAQELETFLQLLHKQDRQTLRHDLRTLAGLRIRATEAAPTAGLITEAARLVVQVKERHGTPDHPRLAEARISRWLAAGSGVPVIFTLTDGAALVGACVGRRTSDTLILHELGLAETARRHAYYLELAFHAPLRHAFEHGLRRVDLGPGHPVVKRNRGAVQRVSWHLGGSPHGVIEEGRWTSPR